jgi:hypothetical protein
MLTFLMDTGTLIIAAFWMGDCVNVEQTGSRDVQP